MKYTLTITLQSKSTYNNQSEICGMITFAGKWQCLTQTAPVS